MGGCRGSREGAALRVLATAGQCPSEPSVLTYAAREAGGAGHTHTYQVAGAAFMDQVDRALRGEAGRPAMVAMAERIASMAERLGCRECPLTWHPEELEGELREDRLAEAWLKYKIRAGGAGHQLAG